MERFFRIPAADAVGCSERTLRRALRDPEHPFPAHRLGRKLLVIAERDLGRRMLGSQALESSGPGRCALNIRPRKFYATRHTFISVGLSAGVNLKWLAEQCGNSMATIEKHYGRFLAREAKAQLRILANAGPEKPATLCTRLPARAEKSLRSGVVPTGIEPVLPT